jgi:D-alanine-D-alanine ligase
MVLALALHKGAAKRIVRDLGFPTPEFAVVESDDDVDRIGLSFPLFVKPVAEGASKGITSASQVHTPADLRAVCRGLLERFRQPVLVETFLPGRELTVGMIGTGRAARALGVMEICLQDHAERDVYSYANKVDYETRVSYRLVDGPLAAQAIETALGVWNGLGCRDGGRVDLRCDLDGKVYFLEVNPLAGLDPGRSDLVILCDLAGVSYQRLIHMIVASAEARMSLAAPADAPSPRLRAATAARSRGTGGRGGRHRRG